ncbi:hypothetical protein J5N97_003985 [Dioscorea zingiberensis]|uniref:Uncharacterized protein n=1 Tax=Dioscorea zingiberensis TaxID=325984 RepID=A0A9D5D6X2_9LILI|nr:hypothetical protein J5N97_003985 [Dioscorea zingiberensis]
MVAKPLSPLLDPAREPTNKPLTREGQGSSYRCRRARPILGIYYTEEVSRVMAMLRAELELNFLSLALTTWPASLFDFMMFDLGSI